MVQLFVFCFCCVIVIVTGAAAAPPAAAAPITVWLCPITTFVEAVYATPSVNLAPGIASLSDHEAVSPVTVTSSWSCGSHMELTISSVGAVVLVGINVRLYLRDAGGVRSGVTLIESTRPATDCAKGALIPLNVYRDADPLG